MTSWTPRCQKLQNRDLRHDRVNTESEPGSEPVDRNVRPRQEVIGTDDVENSQPTMQAVGDVGQTPDGAHVDNPLDAAFSTPLPYPLTSASNYMTVLPVETEFQAVVHGSVDAVPWTGLDDL